MNIFLNKCYFLKKEKFNSLIIRLLSVLNNNNPKIINKKNLKFALILNLSSIKPIKKIKEENKNNSNLSKIL